MRRIRAIAALAAAAATSGCAVSVPVGGLGMTDDVTGSIPHRPSLALEGEDGRRALAALGTALDPQGAGTPVNWDNPTSGAKGAFTPLGHAYPKEAKICRAFKAEIHEAGDERTLHGTACAEKGGEWAVTDVKSLKRA